MEPKDYSELIEMIDPECGSKVGMIYSGTNVAVIFGDEEVGELEEIEVYVKRSPAIIYGGRGL